MNSSHGEPKSILAISSGAGAPKVADACVHLVGLRLTGRGMRSPLASGARTARLVRSQKVEIKYKKPTAARWRSAANHGGTASNLNRFESLQRNPDTCSGQGGGGYKSLQPLGRVTARGSRADFLWPRKLLNFFPEIKEFKRGQRLPPARRPSICKSLDSCSALGPRSGSPSPRNYFPAAGAGGRVESLWHPALDRAAATHLSPRNSGNLFLQEQAPIATAALRLLIGSNCSRQWAAAGASKKRREIQGGGGSWTFIEQMR
jgi:hypothetical protein